MLNSAIDMILYHGSLSVNVVCQSGRDDHLVDLLVPSRMLDFVFRRIGMIGGSWPISFHHVIGHAAVKGRVGLTREVASDFENVFGNLDPIHFAIGSGHETIERYVHERNEFSHEPATDGVPPGISRARTGRTSMVPYLAGGIPDARRIASLRSFASTR